MTGALRAVAVWLVAVAAVVLPVEGAAAQEAQERITAYDVAIVIERTGTILVSETIEYDFGPTPRPGVSRDIRARARHDGRHDRIYPLEVTSVEASPGTPDTYEVEDNGNDRRIRIGDPDRPITGPHQYTIEYRVRAAVTAFADHDELYWNVIGTDWPAPIVTAAVRVNAPEPVERVACFVGPEGSNLPCARSRHEGRSASFVQRDLAPYDGLTVVVGFPKGAVAIASPVLEERWSFARVFRVTPLTLAGAVGLLVVLVVVIGGLVRRTNRDH